jgi:hypothetical protein
MITIVDLTIRLNMISDVHSVSGLSAIETNRAGLGITSVRVATRSPLNSSPLNFARFAGPIFKRQGQKKVAFGNVGSA